MVMGVDDEERAPLMSADEHKDVRPYHSVAGDRKDFGGSHDEEVVCSLLCHCCA